MRGRLAHKVPRFARAARRSLTGRPQESAEHLAAMQRSPEFQAVARRLSGLIEFEPHECEVTHVGELNKLRLR